MLRSGFVLLNWISLAAFLVANTPAGTALRALTSHPEPPHTAEVSPAPCAAEESGCGCCRSAGRAAEVCRSAGPLPALLLTAPDHEEGGPTPACPCPGGCAYCSVAKVPCSLPRVAPAVNNPDPGARVAEAGSTYTSPCADRSTPPPRA